MKKGFILLALFIVGCTPAFEDTITIGAMLPMSGAGAEFGKALHQQMQLAIEDINGAGGVNGKKLEILLEDSKCDASAAENAALKLATDTQVIIGGTCIEELLALGKKFVQISVGAIRSNS